MNVAIFASGNGTNFEVLTKHFQNGDIPGKEALLFCDHPDAYVIKRAQRLGVPYETFTVKSCGSKQAYEEKIMAVLKQYDIDFIVLAGYLRIIGPTILDKYEGSIVNLHPAWLPEYPGLHSIERALPITVRKPASRSTTLIQIWMPERLLRSATCRSILMIRSTRWRRGFTKPSMNCIRKPLRKF